VQVIEVAEAAILKPANQGIELKERKPVTSDALVARANRKRDVADDEDSKPAASEASARSKKKRNDHVAKSSNSNRVASLGDSAFNSLDNATQAWISKIGLKEQYGNEDDGLDTIDVNAYEKPPGFETVFFLTDYLFPVARGEETFHRRLFARKHLVEKSKDGDNVRIALRNFKKKHPGVPLVSWHRKGQKWIPPTAESLVAMIRFIATK